MLRKFRVLTLNHCGGFTLYDIMSVRRMLRQSGGDLLEIRLWGDAEDCDSTWIAAEVCEDPVRMAVGADVSVVSKK